MYSDSDCDLLITITDERGAALFRLKGGITIKWSGLFDQKAVRFSALNAAGSPVAEYQSDVRTVGSGKKARKVRFIADGGADVYVRQGTKEWKRAPAAPAAGALPVGLSLKEGGRSVQVFKQGVLPAAEDNFRTVAIEQPDGSTTQLARREASAFDDLVATVDLQRTRPLEDGKPDYCGDFCYALRVKPKLLGSMDERERCLLLAMAIDPFWSRGQDCIGSLPAGQGGH